VALDTYSSVDSGATPVWRRAPATDLLVDGERYLWLRLTLERDQSPLVSEVRADTGGDSYLDHLPRVYARSDADGFLDRLLGLARSVLGDLEDDIGSLPRRFDPATAPAGSLAWLAGWLAFDPPPGRDNAVQELLAELPELYRARGTPDGVARFVEATTSVRPALVERFRERRTWMLGTSGALGVDTALAPSVPDGLVVGTSTVGTSVPESPDEWGRAVFGDTAHRFTAIVPAGALPERERLRVREALEAEKPAHTRLHLCLVGPAFRVGVQASIGLDTIVAAPPAGGLALAPLRRSTHD
jgi:phage tail-like protein